nr:hypothetical protein [Adhaeribacter radiodurans]
MSNFNPESNTTMRLPYNPRITGLALAGSVLNIVTPGVRASKSVRL